MEVPSVTVDQKLYCQGLGVRGCHSREKRRQTSIKFSDYSSVFSTLRSLFNKVTNFHL